MTARTEEGAAATGPSWSSSLRLRFGLPSRPGRTRAASALLLAVSLPLLLGWTADYGGGLLARATVKRRLQQPSFCYENMVQRNYDMEMNGGSTVYWAAYGSGSLSVISHEGGHALKSEGRTHPSHHGVMASLKDAIPCLAGSGYYLRFRAKVRLYDRDTGAGVTTCHHGVRTRDRTLPDCPYIRFIMLKDSNQFATYYDAHDTNMVWDPEGWNVLDIIIQVPDEGVGDDFSHFLFVVLGGPHNSVLLLDELIVQRLEVQDLPEDHPIFDPSDSYAHKVDCHDNIIINGDGEYQSPWGWDVFGAWGTDKSLDVVTPGYGGDGYAFVCEDRDWKYNGLTQVFDHTHCFRDSNYYIHAEAHVQLYHQETGERITECEWHLDNCPVAFVRTCKMGEPRCTFNLYHDNLMEQRWDPDGWNKLSVIVAFSPGFEETVWDHVKLTVAGGPPGYVLMLDNARVRKISYDEIPAGHEIYSFTGQSLTSPIKKCFSTGDPHILTFGGNKFDNHTMGWQLLYDFGDLQVETHQYTAGGLVAWNNAVRVTYKGVPYLFADGNLPTEDQYYTHREWDEKLLFVDPPVKVFVQWGFMTRGYFYNLWVVTEAVFCTGLCCDVKEDLTIEPPPEAEETVYPEEAPSLEQAQLSCATLEGTDGYQDCIFDFRLLVAVATIEAEQSEDGLINTTLFNGTVIQTNVSGIDAGVDFLNNALGPAAYASMRVSNEIMSENYLALTGMQLNMAGVQGDPLIVGLRDQVFKFEGRSDAWYANLATESLQWNMKFHQFPRCPTGNDVFVSGFSFALREGRAMAHTVVIRVRDEASFFPGCEGEAGGGGGGGGVCLGDGSLEIVVDGEPITKPGDYSSDDMRVVAYNTFEACSRRWYDHAELPKVKRTPETGGRRRLLADEDRVQTPVDLLSRASGWALRPKECKRWTKWRRTYDDLFSQPGGWSTIHIMTPLVNFHVEYRQNLDPERPDDARDGCLSHNIDAWMSDVSPELHSQKWRGILGETRQRKHDALGRQVVTDRESLLLGKLDSDYEVSGPYGTNFAALEVDPWYKSFWKSGLRGGGTQ